MKRTILAGSDSALTPAKLRAGDKVRFVSPASTPDRESVLRGSEILESWGLRVDFGEHAFDKLGYLAGTDEERLSDLNLAFGAPEIRAIFATRGGKGSYRIADGIDFDAVSRDPKFLVGFSDIPFFTSACGSIVGSLACMAHLGMKRPTMTATKRFARC